MKIHYSYHLACLVFFMIVSSVSYGQRTQFSIGIHYGTFNMKDLQGLQKEFLNNLGISVPAKITDDFPSYIGYEGSLTFETGLFRIGVEAGYNSTAGRIAYSDYSGKLLFDQLVKAPKIGITTSYSLSKTEQRWEPLLYLNGGTTFNTYILNYRLETSQTNHVDEVRFKSVNIYVSPGVGVSRNFKRFFLNAKMLYQIDIPSDLTLSSDSDAKLLDSKGDFVQADWSGLRACLAVGIKFGS